MYTNVVTLLFGTCTCRIFFNTYDKHWVLQILIEPDVCSNNNWLDLKDLINTQLLTQSNLV